eukprot:767699_1
MLSDVYQSFNKLQDYYDAKGDTDAWNALRNRWELIEDDMHFGAWFADPRMMEEVYDASEERQAIRYYKMIFGEEYWTETGRVLYAEFRGKTGAFQECIPLSESDTGERAYGWWLRYRKMRNVGRFARKMGQLMRAVGSNSVTERSNNPYKTTQTGMRGSVGPNTLDDLVYSLVNIRFIGIKTIALMYDVDEDLLTTRAYEKRDKKYWKLGEGDEDDDDVKE